MPSERLWPTPQAFDQVEMVRSKEQREATEGGCSNLREVVHDCYSQPDSRVRTSPTLAKERDLRGRVRDCSTKSPVLLARFDPTGCFWRTSQESLLGESMPYAGRWPRWATGSPTAVYELPMSEHHIAAIGGGSSRGRRSGMSATSSEDDASLSLFSDD